MITCPTCGGETDVVDTRRAANYVRRRRYCRRVGVCNGRVTTVEVAVQTMRKGHASPMAVVPHAFIDRLSALLSEVTKPPGDEHPEDVEWPPKPSSTTSKERP